MTECCVTTDVIPTCGGFEEAQCRDELGSMFCRYSDNTASYVSCPSGVCDTNDCCYDCFNGDEDTFSGIAIVETLQDQNVRSPEINGIVSRRGTVRTCRSV